VNAHYRWSLEHALSEAWPVIQFEIHYQPIVEVAARAQPDGGVEALLRCAGETAGASG